MNNPTTQTYNSLTTAYDFFNRELFSDSLPPCLITMQRHKGAFGYFSGERFACAVAKLLAEHPAILYSDRSENNATRVKRAADKVARPVTCLGKTSSAVSLRCMSKADAGLKKFSKNFRSLSYSSSLHTNNSVKLSLCSSRSSASVQQGKEKLQ